MADIITRPILDPCCGGRMFYFDKQNPSVLFCDNRVAPEVVVGNGCNARRFEVNPDMEIDFTNMPFEDETFWHVVFDPPHILHGGETSWLCTKYGKLPDSWKNYLKDGFNECWRVLKTNGTLIFKWNETQISTRKVIEVIGRQPVYGHISGAKSKTHWMCFVKT